MGRGRGHHTKEGKYNTKEVGLVGFGDKGNGRQNRNTFLDYASWWIMLMLTRVGNTREMHVKVREVIGGGRIKKRKVCTVKDNIEFETQSKGS